MTSDNAGEKWADETIHVISPGVCWNLLRQQSLGRLAMNGKTGHPAIYPVNYAVSGPGFFIRTAADSKVRLIADDPRVTFETDARDGDQWWSVVATGLAHHVTVDAELRQARSVMPLSVNPVSKLYVIRVEVSKVTGRRFTDAGPKDAQRARGKEQTAALAEEMASSRPVFISHRAPRSPRA